MMATGCAMLLWAAPAEAVVHEIVAAWCSGQELEPPGVSRGGSKNFAQPVNANGFVGEVVADAELGGLLVTFNYDHPASKVIGTGEFVEIGRAPGNIPIFIELVQPDPDFPAFSRCPRLADFVG
jgi:hypothetical protein